MRTIAVMRHSKAEQAGPTDFERPLAERGRRDSVAAGEWLAEREFEPEYALVSAALRTRETWDGVAEGAGWELDADFDRGLYAADNDAALDLIREIDDEVRRLIVIGHNPTMASLAQLLDDGDADSELADQLFTGYPTSAVAVFEYDGSWADLDEGTARLVAFHVGRG
jgi:phosphohistidine phosphatase